MFVIWYGLIVLGLRAVMSKVDGMYSAIISRAAGSNLRMVRPSLVSVVTLLIIRARSAWQNLNHIIFSSEEALSIALQLQIGIIRPESLVILNVSLMRAHLGTYPAEFYYSNSRPHKCRTRNYVNLG